MIYVHTESFSYRKIRCSPYFTINIKNVIKKDQQQQYNALNLKHQQWSPFLPS